VDEIERDGGSRGQKSNWIGCSARCPAPREVLAYGPVAGDHRLRHGVGAAVIPVSTR
jgi:hypothetical protein